MIFPGKKAAAFGTRQLFFGAKLVYPLRYGMSRPRFAGAYAKVNTSENPTMSKISLTIGRTPVRTMLPPAAVIF